MIRKITPLHSWKRRDPEEEQLIDVLQTFPTTALDQPPSADLQLAELAQRILTAHEAREDYFPPELLGEPAWTMILRTYVAHSRRQSATLASLCDKPELPSTVALRWISALLQEGVFERSAEGNGDGLPRVRLSVSSQEALEEWLKSASRQLSAARAPDDLPK